MSVPPGFGSLLQKPPEQAVQIYPTSSVTSTDQLPYEYNIEVIDLLDSDDEVDDQLDPILEVPTHFNTQPSPIVVSAPMGSISYDEVDDDLDIGGDGDQPQRCEEIEVIDLVSDDDDEEEEDKVEVTNDVEVIEVVTPQIVAPVDVLKKEEPYVDVQPMVASVSAPESASVAAPESASVVAPESASVASTSNLLPPPFIDFSVRALPQANVSSRPISVSTRPMVVSPDSIVSLQPTTSPRAAVLPQQPKPSSSPPPPPPNRRSLRLSMSSRYSPYPTSSITTRSATASTRVITQEVKEEKPDEQLQPRPRTVIRHRYPCPHCNRTFTSPYYATTHRNIFHSTVRTYQCAICGPTRAYKYQSAMNLHLKNGHGGLTWKQYNERFGAAASRTSAAKPNDTTSRLRCNQCTRTFASPKTQRCHMRYFHSDHRSFSCRLCNKLYKYDTSLSSHLKTAHHLNMRQYKVEPKQEPSFTSESSISVQNRRNGRKVS